MLNQKTNTEFRVIRIYISHVYTYFIPLGKDKRVIRSEKKPEYVFHLLPKHTKIG